MYNINKEFLDIYESISATLEENYRIISGAVRITDLKSGLNGLVLEAYRTLSMDASPLTDAELEELESSSGTTNTDILRAEQNAIERTPEYSVLTFLVLASFSSYFKLTNIDITLSSKDESGVSRPSEFAYDGAFDCMTGLFNLIKSTNPEFNETAFRQMLSVSRDCNINTYFEKEYYVEDIKMISKFLNFNKISSNASSEQKSWIDFAFGDLVIPELNSLVDTYSNILGGAFGIDPYVGVFTFNKIHPVVGLSPKGNARDITPAEDFKEYYSKALASELKICIPDAGIKTKVNGSDVLKKFSSRQFNPFAILAGYANDPDTVVYFPYKVLEIISKCEFMENIQLLTYRSCKNNESQNLASYMKYLRGKFEDFLFNFCEIAAISLYQSHYASSGVSFERLLTDTECEGRVQFISDIRDKLNYCQRCMSTTVVLTSLSTGKKRIRSTVSEDILGFRIKVSTPQKTAISSNPVFISNLSRLKFMNPEVMSNPEKTQLVRAGSCSVIDYTYIFNAGKVYAKPIFAFRALDTLKEQAMDKSIPPIDWNRILLGRAADESLVTSTLDGEVHLQKHQMHNIYAGSRSGKGVMGYNIFATAIASGLPMFYLDRKPDTAVVMKSIAPHMFAVNGGQYSEVMDLEKVFEPSGMKFQIPEYVQSFFTKDAVKTDYMYFRAFLLYFCLITFLDSVTNKSDPRYMKIASMMQSGSILVVDEFTNFVEEFLSKFPTTESWFSSTNCLGDRGIVDWGTSISRIKSAQLSLKSKEQAEKPKEEQIVVAKDKLENEIEGAGDFSLHGVYFAAVAEAYKDCISGIPMLFKAGGSAVKKTQIFAIGQDIPSKYYDSNPWFPYSSSRQRFNKSQHDVKGMGKVVDIPLMNTLKEFGGDYILGYQPVNGGMPSYLAQTNKSFLSGSMLTSERGCFCYYDPNTKPTFDGIEKIRNTSAYFNGNKSEMQKFLDHEVKYFKPFLILNNAVEPPAELRTPDIGEFGVSKELAAQRAGMSPRNGVVYKESQYVGQCLTRCNEAGLSWDDIVAGNIDDATGKLRDEVGFRGYIQAMSGTIPVEKMNASGVIMETFVRDVFGYSGSWIDFLADFRPEAIFTPSDFINAIDKPDANTVQIRLQKTFFAPPLVKDANGINFATVFGGKLGSLAQYYAGNGASEGEPEAGYSQFMSMDDEVPRGEGYIVDDSPSSPVSSSDSGHDTGFTHTESPVESGAGFKSAEASRRLSMMSEASESLEDKLERQTREALDRILSRRPEFRRILTPEICELLVKSTVSAYIAQGGM